VPQAIRLRREILALAAAWSVVVELVLAGSLLWLWIDRWAPPQDLPWKPLRMEQPAGLATGFKLAMAEADPRRCKAILSQGGVSLTQVADRTAGRCELVNTVRLQDRAPALSPAAPVMSCQQALAYSLWIRHAVQPAARAELGEPIAQVEHFGTFSCRNIAGSAWRSQHAGANAIDIAGFRTASGRRVSVLRDFDDPGPRGRFLRRVRDGACPWHTAVLSPDYNAAHKDHLHLDRGPFRACR
jgi:hypothetical protein